MGDCYICGHWIQSEIDALIQKSEMDDLLDDRKLEMVTGRINDMLERLYGPDVKRVDDGVVRLHAMRHPMFTTEGQVSVYEDTQMVRVGDKFLGIPTLRQAVVTVLALGVENIRLHPELVTPAHTIRMMELAQKMGMNLGQEELEDVLQRKIAQPTIKKPDAYNPMIPPDAIKTE